MNEHEKQRQKVWADAYMRCALGERQMTADQVRKFADKLLADFDARFPAPAQPAAHGYVPAPSDSRVEQQVRITDSADAQEIAKSLDRAIEQLRGSVFSPVNVTEAVYKEYQRQRELGREYRVASREKKGDTTILHMESVPLPVADVGGKAPAESEADRMWRASKSFNGGQV